MLTIHNLEVRFDVEGEGDEAVFARMFERHMKRWQVVAGDMEEQERNLARERAIIPHLHDGDS